MTQLETYLEFAEEAESIILTGFDEAICGIGYIDGALVYDVSKMVEILVKNDDMDDMEALEYLEFNTIHVKYPSINPIFVYHG